MNRDGLLSVGATARSNDDSQLIPLINIVFLLLIFFMIAGQVSALRERGIELPESGSRAPAQIKPLLLVLETGGAIKLNAQSTSLAALDELLQASRHHDAMPPLALQADKRLKARELGPVLEVIRNAGVSDLTLYVRDGNAPL